MFLSSSSEKAYKIQVLNIKKIFLSAFVVLTFTIYTIHLRRGALEESATGGLSSPSSQKLPQITNIQLVGKYKDGEYVGNVADAYYGNVQIKAVIRGGKITDVQFLDYPQDRRTSIGINSQAMPYLKQEAIQTQSASVDIISGATQTSKAFRVSLKSALDKARK